MDDEDEAATIREAVRAAVLARGRKKRKPKKKEQTENTSLSVPVTD